MEKGSDEGTAGTERFFAVTIFVNDLQRDRQWYIDVFGMPIVDDGPDNCAFRFPDEVYINLNTLASAAEHIAPDPIPPPNTPSRVMLSLRVDDVDAVLDRLAIAGVKPLNGPSDRPWGSRSATIADLSGNYWELFSRPKA